MTVVVHDTPGLLPLEALTVMGLSAKPNSRSPIGFFGTGLKLSIATLVRLGAEVTVWIGESPYIFFTERKEFRGREYERIRMRRKRGVTARWFSEDMPFTTELGKNWELWMALRELHSNTLDEGGETYRPVVKTAEDGHLLMKKADIMGVPDRTRIVVRHPDYAAAYEHLSEVFLPEADRSQPSGVLSLPRPSPHAYYRGLRVLRLEKPALRTWCVYEPLVLTEDRTLAHPWMVQHYARQHVAASDDEAMIRQVVTAPSDTFEGSIGFGNSSMGGVRTSETFRRVAHSLGSGALYGWWLGNHGTVASAPAVPWQRRLAAVLESEDSEPETIGRAITPYRSLVRQLLLRDLGDSPEDEVLF